MLLSLVVWLIVGIVIGVTSWKLLVKETSSNLQAGRQEYLSSRQSRI